MIALVVLLGAASCFAQPLNTLQLDLSSIEDHSLLFDQWMVAHSKAYASAEEKAQRFAAFKDNIQRINAMNAVEDDTPFGLSKFSDLTPQEFKNIYLMDEAMFESARLARRESLPVADLSNANTNIPPAFDWRDVHGGLTPVKDQGQCGSCWAFSTTENVESVWAVQGRHNITQLSVQQIVSCDHVDAGCNGGDLPSAFKYVMQAGGLELEKNYPYTSGNGVTHKCKDKKSEEIANIDGWEYASKDKNETAMAVYLYNYAPISICVDAESWQNYNGGVVKRNCGKSLDHCVQLVGYGKKNNVDAWIVRNSWGKDWGEEGYIYIERFSDLCGIAMEPASSYIRK